MKHAPARAHKPDATDNEALSHLQVAEILVNSRRAALDFTVDQVRELAGIVLVLDDQINTANRRLANMLVTDDAPPAKPQPSAKPEEDHVPLVTGGDPALDKALDAMVSAHRGLEASMFTSNERAARDKLEKAVTAVVKICNPKPRK